MRFYEDIEVGETDRVGEYQVTKEEIVEFAEKYDPQPFHTDEEAAQRSIFGELVASGWHTGAICMRLTVERQRDIATLAGIGVDNLRWHAPLTPGDELHLETEVVDKRPSDRRDDRGYVTTRVEGWTGSGEMIISFEGIALVERRDD
ncbi:Acyl dehydratase [Halomicrobium zhouii]|uniref:Acyl dehydratase n=1 Tax=Halomicrobium zhouii TaxID=767519 RepID=A0A1I6MA93_9EURY|nr:MaoC family dehydratase [Halomicrobium zhouii]SFS12629.1 Acyl dehydratase [Halomicrobium zhouii]